MRKILTLINAFALGLLPSLTSAQCDISTVSIAGTGATMAYTCPGDGGADVLHFDNMTNGTAMYGYVATDDNGIVISFLPSDSADFEGAGPGVCRVYGFAYTGMLTAMMGDDATMIALSDDCYDLSDDYITVVREMPDGGNVLTTGGDRLVTTIPGDGNADVIEFAVSNNSNSNSQYVITDMNGIILGLPPGNMADFEGAPPGTCLVWHLSYTGNLTAMMGDDATMIALSDDCYDLSDNYVEVVRLSGPGPNEIAIVGGGTSITVDLGTTNTIVDFSNNANTAFNYQYVVVDQNGEIVALPVDGTVDFGSFTIGSYSVYGVSYQGNFIALVGDDIMTSMLSDSWFSISTNAVIVDVQSTVGVNELSVENGSFDIYPNPAIDRVTVEAPFDIESVLIYDLNGREVLQHNSTSSSQQQFVEVVGLLPGTYMMAIQAAGTIHTNLFIKN